MELFIWRDAKKIKFKKWQLEFLKESLTYLESEGKKKQRKMAKKILKKI